jgi:hypothetical protein
MPKPVGMSDRRPISMDSLHDAPVLSKASDVLIKRTGLAIISSQKRVRTGNFISP